MTEQASQSDVPPRNAEQRSSLQPLILVVAFFILAILALLFFFDPARHALYPACLFKKLTGYDCPGCGGLRAGHHLLHGHLADAIRLNAMVVVGLPLVLLGALRGARRKARATVPPRRATLTWLWVLVAAIVVFGVVRNLPIWPFGITPG